MARTSEHNSPSSCRKKATMPERNSSRIQQKTEALGKWNDTYISLKSTTVSLSSHWPPLDVVIVFTNLAPVASLVDGSRRPATPARTPLTQRPASRMVAGGRPSAGAHGGGGGPRRRERRRQCSTTHGSTRRRWPAAGARGHGAHAAEAGGGAPAQAAGGDASAEAAVGLTVPLHFVWAGHVGPVRAL